MDASDPKKPFEIDVALERIWEVVRQYPKAAMFELAERGYRTPFQQLVTCVISVLSRDEESLPVSVRIFESALSPELNRLELTSGRRIAFADQIDA